MNKLEIFRFTENLLKKLHETGYRIYELHQNDKWIYMIRRPGDEDTPAGVIEVTDVIKILKNPKLSGSLLFSVYQLSPDE